MKQFAALLTLFTLVSVSAADEFVGIFLQGQRIGYIHTVVSTTPDGKTSTLTATRIGAKVLGQGMSMAIISKSLRKGAILERQELTIESAGRTQNVTAIYTVAEVDVTRVSGETTDKRTLKIPPGAIVLDDPTVGLLGKGAPDPGTKLEFYILDPMTLTLIKNEAEYLGIQPYKAEGVEGKGQKLRIVDPRAVTEIWLDKDGSMVFATGPLGMTMKPVTRAEAVGSDTYMPEVDIAAASRVVPDKPIEDRATIRSLTLRINGTSLTRLSSDYYQSVARGDDGTTTVVVHPLEPPAVPATIATAGKAHPTFTRAGLNMPVEGTEMKALARQITGAESNSFLAAQKISSHVFRIMRPNASIGILRDASEILKTKEGVCRDYATLAATLMRSAGIPTKLVTGAVYSGDAFYYHAWVEAFVGDRWIAFDPTMGGGLADATHIKFAEGNFEEAFITFTLDGNKIEVLKIVRK